jgi:hypothetical protein
MEYSLKTGNDLKCDYSGKQSNVLIKFTSEDFGVTGWFCPEALREAINVVSSLEGVTNPVTQPMPVKRMTAFTKPQNIELLAIAEPEFEEEVEEVAAVIQPKKSAVQDPKILRLQRDFKRACQELIENPPEDSVKGIHDGLSEVHIRELVRDWKGKFADPRAMYSVLQEMFGIPKERLEWL